MSKRHDTGAGAGAGCESDTTKNYRKHQDPLSKTNPPLKEEEEEERGTLNLVVVVVVGGRRIGSRLGEWRNIGPGPGCHR